MGRLCVVFYSICIDLLHITQFNLPNGSQILRGQSLNLQCKGHGEDTGFSFERNGK